MDPPVVLGQAAPALDYHGYVLYASPRPVPGELMREPTGSSVAEPTAVLDEENGRTYLDHDTGRCSCPMIRCVQVVNHGETHGSARRKGLGSHAQAEQDRFDLQHKAFMIYLDGALYRAPIGRPDYFIGIATGTGI